MRIFNRVIYGANEEHDTPYMRQVQIGRLRFHVFYRGDADPDHHDHPWNFWTFPLTPYVEEYVVFDGDGVPEKTELRVVKAFRWHFRHSNFAYRVIGRAGTLLPLCVVPGKRIITIVWRGKGGRAWGFWRMACREWMPWKKYVYEGGKHAPCEDS